MQPYLLETTFLDVIWWMLIVFFWSMYLWMFISVFADVFRREDISGLGKAGWILAFILVPLLGILIYIIVRPKPSPEEMRAMAAQHGAAWHSPTAEIEKAKQLHDAGTITDEEFELLKRRALN